MPANMEKGQKVKFVLRLCVYFTHTRNIFSLMHTSLTSLTAKYLHQHIVPWWEMDQEGARIET